MFKCLLEDCVSNENDSYVGLTTATLSRRLTIHLNDSSSLALNLKATLYLNRKILVENTMGDIKLGNFDNALLHISTTDLKFDFNAAIMLAQIGTNFWS